VFKGTDEQRVYAQNLQNCVEAEVKMGLLLETGPQVVELQQPDYFFMRLET